MPGPMLAHAQLQMSYQTWLIRMTGDTEHMSCNLVYFVVSMPCSPHCMRRHCSRLQFMAWHKLGVQQASVRQHILISVHNV